MCMTLATVSVLPVLGMAWWRAVAVPLSLPACLAIAAALETAATPGGNL